MMRTYTIHYKQDNIQYSWNCKADSISKATEMFWYHFRYSDGISIVRIV